MNDNNMSIESIYRLKDEVTKLVVAGSRSGVDNRRLEKYSEIFQEAGKKSKIFVVLQQAIDRLLASTEEGSSEALCKLLTMVNSLLVLLSKSEIEEELKSVEPISTPLLSSNLSCNQIDDIARASKKRCDKLEEMVETSSEDTTFRSGDPRFFKHLNGDFGSEMALYLNSEEYNRYYAKYMALSLQIANNDSCRSNLQYIGSFISDDISGVARDILDSDAKKLYTVALDILANNIENEQEIIDYTDHKNRTIATGAQLSLVNLYAGNEQKLIDYTKHKNKDVVKSALLALINIESKEVKPIIRAFIKRGKVAVIGDAIIALNDIELVEELCDYIDTDIESWGEVQIDDNGTVRGKGDAAKIKPKVRETIKAILTLAYFHSPKIEETIYGIMFLHNNYFISYILNEYHILSMKLEIDYLTDEVPEWDNIDYIKSDPRLPVIHILYKMRENRLYHDLLYQYAIFTFRQTILFSNNRVEWYRYFSLGWLISTHVVINGAATLFDDIIGYIEELEVVNTVSLKEMLYRVYRLDDRFIKKEMVIDSRFLPLMMTEPGDLYRELKWIYPRLTNIELEEEPNLNKFIDLEKRNFLSHISNLRGRGFHFNGVKFLGEARYLELRSYTHSLLERIKLPEIEVLTMDFILEVMKYEDIYIGNLVQELDEQYPEIMERVVKDPKYSKIGSKFVDNI